MSAADEADRCALRSLSFAEPQHGTASQVRAWVLLEQPGAWGTNALLDSRLPDGLGPELQAAAARLGLKVLLIRRHGRGATSSERTCLLASTTPRRVRLERTRLPGPAAVLDLDLPALARGESLGLEPVAEPAFLVCTHGRHDPCCAERGRPIAAALASRYPEQTWECSHLGGDRFAGNVLAFPHGLYYGRVPAHDAVRVAQEYAGGRIVLPYLRGRCAYPFPVQAAESFLRAELGETRVDALPLTAVQRDGGQTVARFTGPDGRAHLVRVRTGHGVPRRLSCHDAEPSPPPTFELLGIDTG